MPEEVGKTFDTSERDERYAPIRTDAENDVIQIQRNTDVIQTEKCLRVRILKKKIDGQTEKLTNRIGTVVNFIEEIFRCD